MVDLLKLYQTHGFDHFYVLKVKDCLGIFKKNEVRKIHKGYLGKTFILGIHNKKKGYEKDQYIYGIADVVKKKRGNYIMNGVPFEEPIPFTIKTKAEGSILNPVILAGLEKIGGEDM